MNSVKPVGVPDDAKLDLATPLEKQWAQFFAAIDWPARYKPFAVDGFAPTFVLDLIKPIAVFVANVIDVAEYKAVARAAERQGYWTNEILVVGAVPSAGRRYTEAGLDCQVTIGLLGETVQPEDVKKGAKQAFWWEAGGLFLCTACGEIGMLHTVGSYHCRKCGKHKGDHHISATKNGLLPKLVRDVFSANLQAVSRPATEPDHLFCGLIEKPEDIERYSCTSYTFIDEPRFIYTATEALRDDRLGPERIAAARKAFLRAGWEGDGEIGLIWLPPFLFADYSYGKIVWHVKQKNNGFSWLLAPFDLSVFPGFQ